MEKSLFFFLLVVLLFCSCNIFSSKSTVQNEQLVPKPIAIKGLNFVAPPKDYSKNPMPDVKVVNADWIAVIPYGYTMPNETKVHYYEKKNWQWFGETPEGVTKTIQLAHAEDLKVMLKPQVYCPYGWTGGLDFDTDEKWVLWENDYEKYLMQFVEIAKDNNVEMICIGTEFKISVQKRQQFWKKIIHKIRQNYSGKLTYAANWDEYPMVEFWSDLDFVGVNAYFPLIQDKTPSIEALQKAWEKPISDLQKFYDKEKKPIIFTEYGYLSIDSCAYMGWELEKKVKTMNINEQAQANAIEALLLSFSQKNWWQGGFIWKWFPNMEGHEGYIERDYTPQGKMGEKILQKYYGKQ